MTERDPAGDVRQHIIEALAKAIWIHRGRGESTPEQMLADWQEAEREFEAQGKFPLGDN